MSNKCLMRVEFSNLSYKTNESSLERYFSAYGPIEKLVLYRDDQDQSLREGFLIYKTPNSVNELMFNRPHSIDQRQIFVRRSIPKINPSTCPNSIIESLSSELIVNELFISRLYSGETKEYFLNYFQRFGTIVDCRVFHSFSSNRNQSGYAFVRFDDYDSVDRAILSRPHRIDSRIYFVRKSIPRHFHFISSSTKPLSCHKTIWRHYAIGLINVETQAITYPTRSNRIPSIEQSRKLFDETVRPAAKSKSPSNDFEVITAASSLSSSISIVQSTDDDFATIHSTMIFSPNEKI